MFLFLRCWTMKRRPSERGVRWSPRVVSGRKQRATPCTIHSSPVRHGTVSPPRSMPCRSSVPAARRTISWRSTEIGTSRAGDVRPTTSLAVGRCTVSPFRARRRQCRGPPRSRRGPEADRRRRTEERAATVAHAAGTALRRGPPRPALGPDVAAGVGPRARRALRGVVAGAQPHRCPTDVCGVRRDLRRVQAPAT